MLDLVALTPITLRLPGDGNALSRKDGTRRIAGTEKGLRPALGPDLA